MPDGRVTGGSGAAQGGLTPPAADDTHCVAIACTLRSGSNLLCDILQSNGFGEPKEWFQAASVAPNPQAPGSEARLMQRQTHDFLAAHAGQNWRGVKFDWWQFQNLRALAPSLPETAAVLRQVLAGHWIYLRRRDLASQAVSLYAAQITDAWMGEDTADYERVPQDFDAIYERFATLCAAEFAWEEFFRAGGASPMRLYFEDLLDWSAEAWRELLWRLAPDFDPAQLDLNAFRAPARKHGRLRELKSWFRAQIIAGRQPRSLLALLEEVASTVGRLERTPSVDGLLGRFAADVISSPAGFALRKFDIAADLECDGAATLVPQNHFLDRVALRLDPTGSCGFVVAATRVMLQFYAHAWSGVAEIRIGDAVEELDLFAVRAETRHFVRDLPPGFSGRIAVRSTGGKSLLSEGREVWLQRVFVLARRSS